MAFNNGMRNGSVAIRHEKSNVAVKNSGSVTIAKLADQIIIREEADIDRLVQKLADKLEKVSQNLGGGELGYLY